MAGEAFSGSLSAGNTLAVPMQWYKEPETHLSMPHKKQKKSRKSGVVDLHIV